MQKHLFWGMMCIALTLGSGGAMAAATTFGEDVDFLKTHVEVITLADTAGQAQIAVVPAYQGRVMTSTLSGATGLSFGWVNRELIASGEFVPHINTFGGEDRFWMGPEGGQYSIFFSKGTDFTLENWQTPAAIDTAPYEIVSKNDTEVHFRHRTLLTNYSGAEFDVLVERAVRVLDKKTAAQRFGSVFSDEVTCVAFETDNTITNKGADAWNKTTGLLSIWILGMFNPSPDTTIVIPFKPGTESERDRIVNDAYFGKVPSERLLVKEDVLFFSGDGQYRSKIGIGPKHAKPVMGSYDAGNQVLTLVSYTLPKGEEDYVNSMWELQDEPYAGDTVNSYNDGPLGPGKKPLGPFYELETSSPAKALASNASLSHTQCTVHLQGTATALNAIAVKTLGVSLKEIENAFAK